MLEQPYEQAEDPNSTFKDRVSIPSYPVQDWRVIFVYLGSHPVGLLTRLGLFVRRGCPARHRLGRDSVQLDSDYGKFTRSCARRVAAPTFLQLRSRAAEPQRF